MDTKQTRLFFVVDTLILNEEIFDTLEKATKYYDELNVKPDDKPALYIAIVKNAYINTAGEWNYRDLSDTFEIIDYLK